jgi:6-phosphogluconolactonase (cycloisomerase 2 family)
VLRIGGSGLVTGAVAGTGWARRSALAQDATPVPGPGATPVALAARFAYVGTYTLGAPGGGGPGTPEGISIFSVDQATGALTLVETVPSVNPSFLALDPTQRFLYVVNETNDFEGTEAGSVESYAIDPATGLLTFLNRQTSNGAHPTHIAVDLAGDHVAVANYTGGNFVILPIQDDGQLAPISDEIVQTGSGPNEARQEAPHPHAVAFDPIGGFLATADLGNDMVQIFRIDEATGTAAEVSAVAMAPGAGPRHLAFSLDARFLYVINELDATIAVLPFDPTTGQLSDAIQTISTVPDDFVATKSTAEIAVHPSGLFVYGSNRGQEDAESAVADSVAGYTVDQTTGELTFIGHAIDGVDFPRHFGIDPTGTWLYVCNQQADTIVQFAIDQTTGALSATGLVTETPTPVCIVFLSA